MKIFNWHELQNKDSNLLFSELNNPVATGVSIGCFDGVHLGHQKLIKTLVDYCKKNQLLAGVITFSKPLGSLGKNYGGDISTLEQRLSMLEKLGLDFIVIVDIEDFTKTIHAYTGIEFLNLLQEKLNMKYLAEGTNFRCGYKGATDKKIISEYCKNANINCDFVEPVIYSKKDSTDLKISSSEIRKAINNKDYELANAMLGYALI